jgi:serine/threonine protein kinase
MERNNYESGQIKDYEILSPLGQGAYSKVYHVRHRTNGNEYALKVVEQKKLNHSKLNRRLKNEVALQLSLNHPCIVKLYNTFEDDDLIYLVLELCSGGELYTQIKQEGRLVEEDAKSLCSQIVEALGYLHAKGIIHRDLKLGNLLLSEDRTLVKVADFGLAVKLKNFSEERNTLCGTPNYISPEIINRQPYGLASDMWSLGCIIYACLTGSPPFESSSIKNTFSKANELEYSLPKYLSAEARDLISNLLTWNADQRLTIEQVKNHPFFASIFGINVSNMRLSPISRQEITYADYSEQMVSPIKASETRAIPSKKVLRKIFNTKVLPISTSNLCLSLPFKHLLQDGMVEILETGGIVLKLRNKRLEVSSDGLSVIYEGMEMRLNSMTKHCIKLYKYLESVLEAIRSKTPKVSVLVRNARCMLMWNAPPPNFEVDFNDGNRLFMRVGDDVVRICTIDRNIEVSIMQDYGCLDQELRNIIDIAMHGLKLCFEEEKKMIHK